MLWSVRENQRYEKYDLVIRLFAITPEIVIARILAPVAQADRAVDS